eukprot:175660-Rhodomonas_salina.3
MRTSSPTPRTPSLAEAAPLENKAYLQRRVRVERNNERGTTRGRHAVRDHTLLCSAKAAR